MNIIKTVLKNGLTVIVIPQNILPKVSLQLWYGVGSKHERSGIRGIAHLIEHMIFKGTKTLKEGDLDSIVYKLSGSCNAFTSYDYTGYLFDMPSQHYEQVLPIMADCMSNCTFDQEFLNSELKAVIQELKMYKDDNISSLFEELMACMFHDHPYHHPIIGYKNDICSMKTSDLMDFYKTHYVPCNATLVIVGDVEQQSCIEAVEKAFIGIPASSKTDCEQLKKYKSYHERDIVGRNVTLYRDVQQPQCVIAWEIPGLSHASWCTYDLFTNLLGGGRGSRLYKKLVYEQDLVHDVEVFVRDLFDHAMLCVYFRPKNQENSDKIIKYIFDEFALITQHGFEKDEWLSAFRKFKMSFLSACEDVHKVASFAGNLYLATNDENALNQANQINQEIVTDEIQKLLQNYIRPSCVHKGSVLSASEEDMKLWNDLQIEYETQDVQALDSIVRKEPPCEGNLAHPVEIKKPSAVAFPHFDVLNFDNGLTVYIAPLNYSEKIECFVDFKSKHYYDPENYSGRMAVLFDVMEEGTLSHPGALFGQNVESYGMEFESGPGFISLSMLPDDVESGISLLAEYIMQPEFSESSIIRIKDQTLADVKEFWDDAEAFSKQLLRQAIYGKHPYGKNPSGTLKSIALLDGLTLKEGYENYISPHNTVMVFCGKVDKKNIESLVNSYFSKWQGKSIPEVLNELPQPLKKSTIEHKMNRDQVVISYGGLSVARFDPLYDPLVLFDQIFGGGVIRGMSSRLFGIREKTGMFYSIGGTVLGGCGTHPGMMYIKAITSPHLVENACREIESLLVSVAKTVEEDEIVQAQHAIANTLVETYATARNCASSIVFMHRYKLSRDYFEHRAEKLYACSKKQIQEAAEYILDPQKLVLLKVGRV